MRILKVLAPIAVAVYAWFAIAAVRAVIAETIRDREDNTITALLGVVQPRK